jgi:fructosamine-3-kinase
MSIEVFKNNIEAVESLLRNEFGSDVKIKWPDSKNGGTNKSSYEVLIDDKPFFVSVIEPKEVNPTHGLAPDEAKKKHEFFANLSENINTVSIKDRLEDKNNKVSANFSDYVNINENSVSFINIEDSENNRIINKAVIITKNYIANDAGLVRESANDLTNEEAYVLGRAYSGLFKRADDTHSIEELREVFGDKDPYDPNTILANLYESLADNYKLKNIGIGLRISANKKVEVEDSILIDEGKKYVDKFIETVQKIADSYDKIEGLSIGLVHGDPWFDNVILENGNIKAQDLTNKPLKSIGIDLENTGIGYKAVDALMTLTSLNAVDNKTGVLTEKGKNALRGYDEVKILDENFEKYSFLLKALAEAYIGNMRLDKFANGVFNKRSPKEIIEDCGTSIENYENGMEIKTKDILTCPSSEILAQEGMKHINKRFSALSQ